MNNEAQYLLASIVESSQDSIVSIDLNRTITTWNKAAELLYGYSAEEVVGKTLDVVVLPEDVHQLLLDIDEIRHSGTVLIYDTVRVHKDGQPLELEIVLSPVKDSDGQVIGVSTLARDITRRRGTEKALTESEERLRTLTNAVPHIIWTNTSAGYADFFNQRWYDYCGLDYDSSKGLGWEAIVHPEDADASKARWHQALIDGKTFETEYRLRDADGSYRWFIGRNVPLLDGSGNVLSWFGSATDIEALKNAEASLIESRERLRITMESAVDYAIMTLDMNGNYTSWSNGAELILGYTSEEAIGQSSELIFTPEDVAKGAHLQEMEQALAVGRAEDERWHLRKDGTRLFMSGVMAPIISNGRSLGFVKVARDMTVRKLHEQQKDEFIGIASHELKTPVTSVKIFGEVLHELLKEDGDSQKLDITGKLNNQVDRMVLLINMLLDTTQISEGKLALRKDLLDFNALVTDRVEEIQALSHKHTIVLNLGEVGTVQADKERLGQVITNLLSNAVKYSPNGGSVTVTTREAGDGIELSVTDEGIGIQEHVRGKVFERFFRSDNLQVQTYPGMGLGLYISSGIIHAHGGKISVESSEGKGSTFYITLPYGSKTTS